MRDSIIINMQYADYDIIDGTPSVQRHHVFGAANRGKSDQDGLWVPLTPEHHQGKMSVHKNKEMAALMHIIGQLAWEKKYIIDALEIPFDDIESEAREAFRSRYGKSYL